MARLAWPIKEVNVCFEGIVVYLNLEYIQPVLNYIKMEVYIYIYIFTVLVYILKS